MSKQDKTDESTQPDDAASSDDATFADVPEEEPGSEPEQPAALEADTAPPAATPARKGGGVAWLALLLSLAALAGSGYLLYEDWRTGSAAEDSSSSMASSLSNLGSRVDAAGETLANLDRGLAELGDQSSRTSSELDTLRRDYENRVGLFDSLPPRVSTLESSIAALQGVSAGARETFLLAESEYYMQIANAQLQLAGNPHLAALALGMADERIVQLADPALTGVRRAIADELAALDAMEKPDIEGVTLTLASLSRVVDALPLRQSDGADIDSVADDGEEAGRMGRAWNSVKGAMSGLVKVTPPNEAEMPLIAPDQVYFLRTNLALQLQSARLALLRGEKAVFEQSLDDAAAWLRQYFDTGSTQVSSTLTTISEIRDGLFAVAPPDISESLRLLRQFRLLAETAP